MKLFSRTLNSLPRRLCGRCATKPCLVVGRTWPVWGTACALVNCCLPAFDEAVPLRLDTRKDLKIRSYDYINSTTYKWRCRWRRNSSMMRWKQNLKIFNYKQLKPSDGWASAETAGTWFSVATKRLLTGLSMAELGGRSESKFRFYADLTPVHQLLPAVFGRDCPVVGRCDVVGRGKLFGWESIMF